MDLAQKAKIKSELAARGIYWTDSQIEQYATKFEQTPTPVTPPPTESPYGTIVPQEPRSGLAVATENVIDFVGASLWQAADVGTFGLAGLGLKTVSEDAYDWLQRETTDTAGGRVGGAIGGLAGFMLPMGVVARGTSLAARSLKGISQARKVKKGLTVANPTTRTLQNQAAKKVMKESGGKLTWQEAKKVVRESSDDIIGFSQKGQPWWQKIIGKGPAYQLEHAASHVNQARLNLQRLMPDRLAAGLKSRGVSLNKDQLLKLSDDVVEMIGTKPFNSIETILAGKYTGKIAAPVMNLVGGVAQEALNFGIVGTVMDQVLLARGDLDRSDYDLKEQMLHHAAIGGMFGGVRFVPGGRAQSVWRDIATYSGRATSKLNKSVSAMGLDETKAFARMTMKNNKSVSYIVNGRKVSPRELRKGTGIKENELDALKTAIIKKNNETLKQFSDWKTLGWDATKDIMASAPRMAIGSVVFNAAMLEADETGKNAFYHLHPAEGLFHLGLGALMTKSGKALIPGKGRQQFLGMNFGDKEYYYNSDLREIRQELDRSYVTGENIGDIVKEFDGNLFTDWAAKNPIQDIENIVDVLRKNNVIYDVSENGVITRSTSNQVALRDRELLNLIEPVLAALQARNLELNPNVTKKELKTALENIKTTESSILSSPEKKVFLNSRRNITNSIYEGAAEKWTAIEKDLYDNFSQQIGILTGDPKYLGADGKMNEYFFDDRGLTTAQQLALRKLDDIRLSFEAMDLVQMRDFTTGKGRGMPIELTTEKIQKIIELQDRWEMDLGREFYGKDAGMAIDMMDQTMWNLFSTLDFHKNVSRVYDVMLGKEVPGFSADESRSIQSLLNTVLSNEKNKNHDIITESPQKINLSPEGIESPQEYHMLKDMLENLWSISNASGRRPVDGRPVEVTIDQARSLKDKLVKAGMPDPEKHVFGLDTRMQTWVEKTISHGISEVLGGLDMDPYKAEAVRRLMANGILQHSTDALGRSLGLQRASTLTIENIKRIQPGISDAEAMKIKEAYDNVMNQLGTTLAAPREDLALSGITDNQLSSILAADRLLNSEKIKLDIEEIQDNIAIPLVGYKEENKILSKNLENAAPDAVSEIKARMEVNSKKQEILSNLQLSFSAALGGGVEMSRASAYIFQLNNMAGKNGRTIMDEVRRLDDVKTNKDFNSITEQIRELQVAIANKIEERADVKQWSDRRLEAEARYQAEEVQGKLPADRTNTTPDVFFKKHNIAIEDIFKSGEEFATTTFDSASDVLYKLYSTRDVNEFSNRLFELAGTNVKNAPNELRNEVMHLSNLFERRYNVKRLAISEGSGIFEKADISKGYLTDHHSEVFGGEVEMILLSSDYFQNGKYHSTATNLEGLPWIRSVLHSDSFAAVLKEGGITNMKYLKDGRAVPIEGGQDLFHTIDLNGQSIRGRHHIISIDENINLVIPEAGFNKLGESFVRWYERVSKSDYVKNAKNQKGQLGTSVKDLFQDLDAYYKRLVEIKNQEGTYNPEIFRQDAGTSKVNQYIEDAMFKMYNVMYGERIDRDWLQDAYFSNQGAQSSFKYKRLAQNQGYSRNSNERRQILKSLYKNTDNKYYKKIIKKYSDKDLINVAVINDSGEGIKSITGEAATGFITDNRSIAEAKLEEVRSKIGEDVYKEMRDIIRDSNSLPSEAVNGMTVVNRELLDYLLLLSGQENLIGKSSGQKPVGLSSFVDDNGNMHVFYNKTHYFYDSRLDPFFKKNKQIDQIAFTSGAKKTKIINEKDKNLANKFEAISDIPNIESGQTLSGYINGLSLKEGDRGVMPVKLDETLAGVVYGAPKGARIMKQFDNWASNKTQKDLYEWSRADLAEQFSEVNIRLYNPENVGEASREARSFISKEGNKDGTISTEAPDASVASIWIEAGGVPFSEMSKNLYDALIKRRHIDDAGVFDGFTDAGGVPVLRGNMDMNLGIPIYSQGKQLKLGEANIGAEYLDRTIHYQFGAVPKGKPGVIKRPKYVGKSALTIAFDFKGRDVIVDMKTKQIYDPKNEKADLSKAEYNDINKMVKILFDQLESKKISTYRDVFNVLQGSEYTGAQLAIMTMPAPRTGPHDAMVVKVRNILDPKDGGLIELNSWDVTMRGQRDYDTDKLPFYMDTPFSAMTDAFSSNGMIMEPRPTNRKNLPELNLYDNQSFKNYNQNIQQFKRSRGPVIKMHRKLTYAKRLFESIDGLEIGGQKIIFAKDIKDPMQRLVDDSQNILDIYKGTPELLDNLNAWSDRTLFGNSQKTEGRINVDVDKPFFQLKEGGAIVEKGHKLIIEKILDDFGRLLQLEGNIYEFGEAKTPKYSDMVSAYREFRHGYHLESVNWNFYHYIKKRAGEAIADQLFFEGNPKLKDKKMITPVMNKVAGQILKGGKEDHLTPFLKSLYKITEKDRFKVRETYGRSGNDYFNEGVQKLIGRRRAEALEIFQTEGVLADQQLNDKNNLINDLWDKFYANRTHEEMMVQANTIESELRRAERRFEVESKKQSPDESYLEMLGEDIFIKSKSLDAMMNKMTLLPYGKGHELQQELKYFNPKDGANNKVTATEFKPIVIRDKRTGDWKKQLKAEETYELGFNDVAVYKPVTLKPVVEHELIDGAAFAYSVLGRYSHVMETDLPEFRRIVLDVKKEIKKSASNLMKTKGARDWSKHQSNAQAAIDKGLQRIKELAMKDADILSDNAQTWLGQMPANKVTYGEDFLLSLLLPDWKGNPNELHYSPKTGNFMPAVMAPKRSVINAVMKSMEQYNVTGDFKGFVQDFASTHRGFYESIVAGRGIHEGLQRLAETSFEGALLQTTIGKVMNNTFMRRKDYKSMDEVFDAMPPILSDYAELYRQILQEGSLADPMTAFGLRQQIIKDPSLGVEGYNRIFQQARGHMILDGFTARQYGIRQGEGQMLGEILMSRNDARRRQITGSKKATKGSEIRDFIDTTVGKENTIREGCKY